MIDFLYTLFVGRRLPDETKREQLTFLVGIALFFLLVLTLCYIKANYGVELAHWIEANYPYPIR